MKEKIILFEKVVDDDISKTIESLTNIFTLVYYFILFNKTFISLAYLVKSNKLLDSIELFVQNFFKFDLLDLS